MSLTTRALAKLDDEKLEQLTLRASELCTLMGQVNEALEREQTPSPAPPPPPPPPPPARRDKLSQSLPMDADRPGFSQSLPTHPAAKKVLVDKYAEIALFDADQNQQEILRSGALEMRKKTAMKRALDEQVRVPWPPAFSRAPQSWHALRAACATAALRPPASWPAPRPTSYALQVRVKQATVLKERAQEREWLHREQARVLVWNDEEKKKIAEERSKYGQAS